MDIASFVDAFTIILRAYNAHISIIINCNGKAPTWGANDTL